MAAWKQIWKERGGWFLFWCVCVCVCHTCTPSPPRTCTFDYTCECRHMCVRSEDNLQCHSLGPPLLSFETGSLNCLELHQAGLTLWPARSRYLLVSAFPGLAFLGYVSNLGSDPGSRALHSPGKYSPTKPHPSSKSCFSSVLKSRSRQWQRM